MDVKAVEMVREIRDRNYEQTRGLSPEEQIKFIRRKARRLQKTLGSDAGGKKSK